ncbi:hypothetical protein UPYG_G00180240 [Umbra pygmaea]|uniref:Uncharacterized protein n=1 Tax=Umbra pygmaea TaxID=75934 RepID=A0ABD0WUZ2_UMBPY
MWKRRRQKRHEVVHHPHPDHQEAIKKPGNKEARKVPGRAYRVEQCCIASLQHSALIFLGTWVPNHNQLLPVPWLLGWMEQ